MRFAIIYRPKDPPTPEQMPATTKAMAAWAQKYGGKMDAFEFFIGGGGFGTLDIDDAAELSRMITENPYTLHSEIEIKPLVDPATGMAIAQETYS